MVELKLAFPLPNLCTQDIFKPRSPFHSIESLREATQQRLRRILHSLCFLPLL